jgi:hypothetical protein
VEALGCTTIFSCRSPPPSLLPVPTSLFPCIDWDLQVSFQSIVPLSNYPDPGLHVLLQDLRILNHHLKNCSLLARLSTEEGFFIFPGDGLLRCLELERERVGVKSRKEKVPGTVSLILVRLGVRVLSLDLPRPLLGVANLK